MANSNLIIQELADSIELQFSNRQYFACVYGSYAYNCHTFDSDIDFFVAVTELKPTDTQKMIDVMKFLAEKYNLGLDAEVPYENKLVVSLDDLNHMAALDAFDLDSNNQTVPTVKKDEIFLSSPEIRWRLLMNALTTPHLFIAGNQNFYSAQRERAEYALRDLANYLAPSDPTQKIERLFVNPDGVAGEMYLGYKSERIAVRRYIEGILEQ